MTTQLEISAESLRNTLAEASFPELRRFARSCGIEYQQQWSGLDLVAQARRWAVFQQQNDIVTAIDRSVADAWASVATQLCDTRIQSGSANTELLGDGWVRSLSLLTERFPSNVVHEAFVRAMLAVAQKMPPIAIAQGFLNPSRISVALETKLFTPTWLRTINKSSQEQMQEVFHECRMMFRPGDYFAGYVMAWRYGADIAAHYTWALRHALPRGLFFELPLGSDRQLDELEKLVITSMSLPHIEKFGLQVSQENIFNELNGPLSAWSKWLNGVFCENIKPQEEHITTQFIQSSIGGGNDAAWFDEDQDYQPRSELASLTNFFRQGSLRPAMGAPA